MKTQLRDKESISAIISEMTLEEKLTLLTGDTTFRGGKNEGHGIPAPLFLDGGTGFNSKQMRLETLFNAYESIVSPCDPEKFTEPLAAFGLSTALAAKTAQMEGMDEDTKKIKEYSARKMAEIKPVDAELGCFPPGMLLGATMNPEVVRRCGEAVGREASACHVDVLLGTPNVNLHRDPLNGRLFEGYSEDPCVVSELAPYFAEGVQAAGVVANVKHFAANNQETDRMGVNEIISERALRELYLPGFKACVEKGCKTVMSAYNKINGIPCAQNSWLLKDVLREEWGFEGFVMSDWGAVYDRVGGQQSGNDVTMPGPREIGSLIRAVEEGRLKTEDVDKACENYLKILLEMPVMKGVQYPQIDSAYSMKAAYEAACEGITLLKNTGVLPLKRDSHVSFYGNKSKKFVECGTGSAAVITEASTNLYDSACAVVGGERIRYQTVTDQTDVVVVTVGVSGGEGADRQNMDMDQADRHMLEEAIADAKRIGKPVVLILNISGPIELMEYIEDADAVLCVYLPGMAGGKAAADILFGIKNPSGKLPLTFPKYYRDTPTYFNFPGEYQEVNYGEGIYVGYRYYDKKKIEPLFPFGHGLSYTTFELSDLCVPKTAFSQSDTVEVSLKIRNTGVYAGAEVVQLYICDPESKLDRPVKELKKFRKVYVNPGETKEILFTLTKEELGCYDTKLGRFVTEPGEFKILIGTSSRNIVMEASMEAECPSPYELSGKTEIVNIAANPKAMEVIHRYLPEMDLKETAGVYIVFLPFMPFEEVWKRCIAPEIADKTEETPEKIYEKIMADFKQTGRDNYV